MPGQLPKRPSGAGYKQSCLHFEVKHRTQTWAVAYCSFAGRASAGMFVYAESEIVRFWRSQKVTAYSNCLVLAFEQTPRDLPRLASGSRWKRRKEDQKSTSRVVQVWDSEKLIRFIPASRRLIRIQRA
jgi:hypothetical protein